MPHWRLLGAAFAPTGRRIVFALIVAALAAGLAAGGAIGQTTLTGIATSLDYIRSQPPYPPAALAGREEGLVKVTACIDTQGIVTEAKVVTSSGHPSLDAATLDWIRSIPFAPPRKDGVGACVIALSHNWRLPVEQMQPDPPQAGVSEPPPTTTAHVIQLGGHELRYRATIGLQPIRVAGASAPIGDMSYITYTTDAGLRGRRPIIFLWNGGPGANSIPINYGAFGPRRLVGGDHIEDNPATLLDVGDLVFIDMMNTGFGRSADQAAFDAVRNETANTATFVAFIEGYMAQANAKGRPIIIAGESYGVRRVALVAPQLIRDGLKVQGLVLISGYPSIASSSLQKVGPFDVAEDAALSFELGLGAFPRGADVLTAHAIGTKWAKSVSDALEASPRDDEALNSLAHQFAAFTGAPVSDMFEGHGRLPPKYWAAELGDTMRKFYAEKIEASERAKALPRGGAPYDIRYKPGPFDSVWISQAVVDDLRKDLGFNPRRRYLGEQALPPNPGLASEIGTPLARFEWRASAPLLPNLLKATPDLRVFIASGMFDGVFPCATTEQIAGEDLAGSPGRGEIRCYAGGHMMYYDRDVAARLTSDIRAFVSKTKH